MASSHNRGFILPTVKRLLVVKVRLHSLVSYDDPQCKPPTCSLCTCSSAKVLLFLWNYNTSSARSARNILWRVSHIFKMCFTSSSSFSLCVSASFLTVFPQISRTRDIHTSTESTPQSSPYPRDIWAMGWPDGGCRLGAYACAHFLCTPPPSVRVSSVKVEHRKREIKHYALYCKCRSILITEMGLASWISRVLYDAVFQCRPRISEPRDVPRRCYQQC